MATRITLTPLDVIMGQIGAAVDEVVRTSTFAIGAGTRQLIVELDAVDTGFMLNSTTEKTSTDGLPLGQGEVYVGAEYAIYVHDGARGREARPFLFVAMTDEYPELRRALADLFRG